MDESYKLSVGFVITENRKHVYPTSTSDKNITTVIVLMKISNCLKIMTH